MKFDDQITKITMDLQAFTKSLSESDPSQYLELILKLDSLLERESRISYPEFSSQGGLVNLNRSGRAIVIGDLHGDLQSLIQILSQYLTQLSSSDLKLIFLGDYVDRGQHSTQVLQLIFTLKLRFASKLILLKGNHESTYFIPVYPHDLPIQLSRRFGQDGQLIYAELLKIFSKLPHAVVVPQRYLMVHGGIPAGLRCLDQLRNPDPSILEQILWGDPDDFIQGTRESPRGAGNLFGRDVSSSVLDCLGLRYLIRSHQPCNGFMYSHGGRVITVFSRLGFPYFNTRAGYLELDLEADADPIPRWI